MDRLSRRGLLGAGLGALLLPKRGLALSSSYQGRFQPLMPLSNTLTVRLQNSAFANTGGSGQTISALNQLPASPRWVRFVVPNDQTGASWILSGAAIAPTSIGAGYNGSDPSLAYDATQTVNSALWQSVTFNNGGSDLSPLSQNSGSTAALTLPDNPNTDSGQPLYLFSDWMSLAGSTAALTRLDGGQGSLLLVRWYSSGTVRYSGAATPNSIIGITNPSGTWASGNKTTSGNYTTLGNSFGFGCPYGLQFISDVEGATVIGIGDSISQSLCTTGADSGFGIFASQALNSTALPIAYLNAGYSGRTTTDFCNDGINQVRLFKPQIAVIQAWSENDSSGGTQASVDAGFNNAMGLARFCRLNGCIPILTTAAPVYYGQSSGYAPETWRVYSNNLVRAAAKQGTFILDLDAMWGTGSNPVTWAYSGYQCATGGEQQHPTDLACEVAAGVTSPSVAFSQPATTLITTFSHIFGLT